MAQNYAQGRNAPESEWQHQLFDCGPAETCFMGCCLPCVLVGKTADRMRDPTGQTHETINRECLIFCAINSFTGCGWIYSMLKRGEIRERYNIKGSGGSDCCTSYWCVCCAVIQQDKEVASRNATGGGAPVTQGYQSQKEGMHMPGATSGQPQHQQQQLQQQHQPQIQQQQQQYPEHQQAYSPPPQQQPGVVDQAQYDHPQYAQQQQGHDGVYQQQGHEGGYPHGKQ